MGAARGRARTAPHAQHITHLMTFGDLTEFDHPLRSACHTRFDSVFAARRGAEKRRAQGLGCAKLCSALRQEHQCTTDTEAATRLPHVSVCAACAAACALSAAAAPSGAPGAAELAPLAAAIVATVAAARFVELTSCWNRQPCASHVAAAKLSGGVAERAIAFTLDGMPPDLSSAASLILPRTGASTLCPRPAPFGATWSRCASLRASTPCRATTRTSGNWTK
jgi:hypothetical protein